MPLAFGAVFLVLMVLAADLDEDIEEDHVDDESDAPEGGKESEVSTTALSNASTPLLG